jgi:hypothetical protein
MEYRNSYGLKFRTNAEMEEWETHLFSCSIEQLEQRLNDTPYPMLKNRTK